MRTYEKGDKVLFITNSCGGNLKKGELGIIYDLDKCNRVTNFLEERHSVSNFSRFILAETDSIERALEHIQKDMWVEMEDGAILKVRMVDVGSITDRHFYFENIWRCDKDILKIYFYNPELKQGDSKIKELEDKIAQAQKNLEDAQEQLKGLKEGEE